ncbi:MAG: hypothetical protein KKI12_02340 [Proteobacteria bacterium]|nr:hypothetical protein [Pseudomonadota bacterium]MBU4286992.1 hypothetical protein [Pseudomonadota bacterium]MBU4414212.1 hypothetical protein [Pseudomonadota bacterium]MCG2757182.1 hypothetical protein [Desulfobacteraceae bacterium]
MKTEIQRICVKAKPTESNPDYYDWQTASIVMFIPENNKSLALKKARDELRRRHWEFTNYEDKSTLIEERVKKEGGEVWETYLSAKKGNIFFRVFPDHFGAGRDGIQPIRPARIEESFIDSVIISAGGKKIPKSTQPGENRADYTIGDFIFELKDIQEEGLQKDTHQNRMAELFEPYFPGKSEITVDPSILSKPDFLKYLDIISKPIKTHIKKASKQIKATRKYLEQPDFKGGIILLNTGFGSFPHEEFAIQVERFARKDSKQFEAIISISTWFYTNGFDSYMFYKFSPEEPRYQEIERIRKAFNDSFEKMMTEAVLGKLPDSAELTSPLSPVAFNYRGIDFNWKPRQIPLPWKKSGH